MIATARLALAVALLTTMLAPVICGQIPSGGYSSPAAGGAAANSPTSLVASLVSGASQVLVANTGSGTTVKDYSGNGNDCVFGAGGNAPAWGTGPMPGVIFSGTNATPQFCSDPAGLNSAQTIQIFQTIAAAYQSPGNEPVTQCPIAGTNALHNFSILLNTGGSYSGVSTNGGMKFWTNNNSNNGLDPAIEIINGTQMISVVLGSSGNATTDKQYVGTVLSSSAVNPSQLSGTQTLGNYQWGGSTVGGLLGSGCPFHGTGYVKLMYTSQLTDAQIAQNVMAVQNFMSAYGIVATNAGNATNAVDEIHALPDSLTGTGGVANSLPYLSLMLPVGASVNLDSTGQAAERAYQMRQALPEMGAALYHGAAGRNTAIMWACSNDIGLSSRTPQQCLADLEASAAILHSQGYKVIVVGPISRTGFDVQMEALASLIRNSWRTWADAFADLTASTAIGAAGTSTGGNFNGDGIHPSLTGILVEIQLIQAAYNGLYGYTVQNGNALTIKTGATALPYPVHLNKECRAMTGASPTCTLSQAVLAGSDMVAGILWLSSSNTTITSVTSVRCPTWTATTTRAVFGNTVFTQLWNSPNCSAGAADVITVNFSDANATAGQVLAVELANIVTAAPIDCAVNPVAGVASPLTSNSCTTTVANDYLLGYGSLWNNAMFTSGIDSTGGSGSYRMLTTNISSKQGFEDSCLEGYLTGVCNTSIGAHTATMIAADSVAGVSITEMALAALKPANWGATNQLPDFARFVNCDPSGGSITLTLPEAVGMTGQTITIKNIQTAGVNTCTVQGLGAETIDAAASVTVANKATLVLQSQVVSPTAGGANWIQLQNN